jgi:hypothetical protein
MKTLKLFIPLLLLFSLLISCKQLQELQNLTKCEFRLNNIQILSIDNVDVSKVKSINNIDVLTVAKLSKIILSSNIPISYIANIEVKNPNSQKASLNKFALQIIFNETEIVQTEINKYVEVMPNQSTLIPVNMTSNIAQIVKGENINSILGLLFPGNDNPAVFTIKLKPSILVGPITIDYPGYITLSKDFKSN